MRLLNIPRCFYCGSSHEPGTTAFSKLSKLIAGLACYCLGSRACNCCARSPWWQFCVGKMSNRHSVRHPSHVVIARRDVSDNRKAKETLAGVALADCPTIHLSSLSAASQPKRQVHRLTYTFCHPKPHCCPFGNKCGTCSTLSLIPVGFTQDEKRPDRGLQPNRSLHFHSTCGRCKFTQPVLT